MHKSLGEFDPLLHTGRIGLDIPVTGFSETTVVKDFVSPPERLARRHPCKLACVRDELDGGHAWNVAILLGHQPDLLSNGIAGLDDVQAKDARAAADRFDESQNGLQQRRLACAIRPQQAGTAFRNLTRQAVQSREMSIADDKVVY